MKKIRVAILQPEIPHYRVEFFSLLEKQLSLLDVYVYNRVDKTLLQGFCLTIKKFIYIPNFVFKGILFYNLFYLLNKRYDTLILMLHRGHFSTWLLLCTKIFHRKRIILWGHGISTQRYLTEEIRSNMLTKNMLCLADGVWLYTQKEALMWAKLFPNKPIVALNNTISNINGILDYSPCLAKDVLKRKYNVNEGFVLLFCARFNSINRRIDLLLECIERLDPEKFGFIIIGKGEHKPDFSKYHNVHDMGEIYSRELKQELFTLSDIYFQPAWIGLSVVEAMGYALPIFTFKRSNDIKQGVEYSYIQDEYNGRIFGDMDGLIEELNSLHQDRIRQMGENAKKYVRENLTMEHMVNAALSIL